MSLLWWQCHYKLTNWLAEWHCLKQIDNGITVVTMALLIWQTDLTSDLVIRLLAILLCGDNVTINMTTYLPSEIVINLLTTLVLRSDCQNISDIVHTVKTTRLCQCQKAGFIIIVFCFRVLIVEMSSSSLWQCYC